MKKTFACVTAAMIFFLLLLTLSTPLGTRVVKADDIHERCEDCTIRNNARFEHCLALHGINEQRCYEQYNQGVINCHRNFCEQ